MWQDFTVQISEKQVKLYMYIDPDKLILWA